MMEQDRDILSIDLAYPLRWRVSSILYGSHRAIGHSDSGHFRGFQPFIRHPDIRRLDLRRSLRDPFGQWYVKDYEPRAPVQIHLLVDVSASMQTGSHQRQIDQVADICALVAQAAYRNGDALSFFACGSTIEYQYAPPNQRARANSARAIRTWLQQTSAQAHSAQALVAAAQRLRRRRSLVFLISDFMFTLEQCRQILEPLRPHDVIPIVLDTQNLGRLPAWGLTFWHDAESGQKKMLFMRPSLLKQWQTRQAQQQKALTTLLQRYGLSPFRPGEQFRAPALARHLMER